MKLVLGKQHFRQIVIGGQSGALKNPSFRCPESLLTRNGIRELSCIFNIKTQLVNSALVWILLFALYIHHREVNFV